MIDQCDRLVLITGGCGFIGRHLSLRLRGQGVGVRILDNLSPQIHGVDYDGNWMDKEGMDFLKGSVCDASVCAEAVSGVDAVVHLAAETGTGQSMYEMARYMHTNVTGTATLLETRAEQCVPKIVLSSSRAVYGEGMWVCSRCGPVHPEPRSSMEGRVVG